MRPTIDPASFRDPAGSVYNLNNRVFRTVCSEGLDDYIFVRDSGVLTPLIEEGLIIRGEEIDATEIAGHFSDSNLVLEHPKVPFWSYPYEWTFGALKAAALLHLDIQIKLLEQNISLSDASAYNLQFDGARPIFVDTLSFRKYSENEHWAGHRQFCEQFLNPLLLQSCLGVPFNNWYRGELDGIPTENIGKLLRLRHYLSWRILSHVILQSKLHSWRSDRVLTAATKAKARGIPRSSYLAMLAQLRSWISKLTLGNHKNTLWGNYADENTYEENELGKKKEFVAEFAKSVRPGLMIDLGCNTGDYSKLALESGAKTVIGFDIDHGALDQAFERSTTENLNFTPLYQDFANPSPGQGWNHSERKRLAERFGDVDAVIALAFAHHLVIGRNIPLDQFVDWLVAVAPTGIIEFVQKDDPTVQKMLSLRSDIFPDYTIDIFADLLERHARIARRQKVSDTGRELFWFDRR